MATAPAEPRSRAAGPHHRRRVDQPGADGRHGDVTPTCTSPTAAGCRAAVNRVTRKDENVYFDALGLAETLFDDHMASNMLVLGAAYQAGAIPVSAAAIEEAIALNGVPVAMNTHAFRAGRLLVADPAGWRRSSATALGAAAETARVLDAGRARAGRRAVAADGELRRLLEIRVPELIAYQDDALRRRLRRLREPRADGRARRPRPARRGLSEAVARYLFKLMAYKDEYEVARLHLQADMSRSLAEEYPRRRARAVHAAPAAAPRARSHPQAQVRPVVRRRLPRAGRDEEPAGTAPRSVRPRDGPAGRACAAR